MCAGVDEEVAVGEADEQIGPDGPPAHRDRYGKPAQTDWARISKWTLVGVLAAAAVTFVLSNQDPVAVSFLTISMDTTLFWALLFALVLGALIGALLTLGWQRRRRRREVRRSE